tara:strand:- start:18979 stop:19941 length:963 start_codon:yes stop_codon:yes gene_type:complete
MKIKILVLGYSRIFQKRVLPALKKVRMVDSISVASLSKKIVKNDLITQVYNSYEEALKKFDGTFVYVSLSNNLHDEFVLKSLEKGFNVIVDKPAIIKQSTMDKVEDIVSKSGLGIYESSVYSFHPVFNFLKKLIKKYEIEKIISIFRIPIIHKNDFRFQNLVGSGAEFDMSVYSLGFYNELFEEDINDLNILDVRKMKNIVKSFDIQLKTKDKTDFYGFYGFDSEYEHSAFFVGKGIKFEIKRIFSNPADTKLILKKTVNNKTSFTEFDEVDSFFNFFEYVFQKKDRNEKTSLQKLKNNFNNLKLLKSKISNYEKLNAKN